MPTSRNLYGGQSLSTVVPKPDTAVRAAAMAARITTTLTRQAALRGLCQSPVAHCGSVGIASNRQVAALALSVRGPERGYAALLAFATPISLAQIAAPTAPMTSA